ncbi:hypothetical protein ONS96_006004 [Cadophora gregata f. sp. sojae]|nr:hypothetical protein ONS96_006004 [Cadophora gregata f. sp. sojae]
MDDHVARTAPMDLPNNIKLDDLIGMLKSAEALNQDVSELHRQNCLVRLDQDEDTSRPLSRLLKDQCEILDSLIQGLADFHESVRKTINICSRPSVRHLGLLDMPDEILFNVCGYARGWEISHHIDSRNQIPAEALNTVRSLRLTCRKFNDTSSHLLIPFIRFDPTDSASIARFDNISRHPLICKGVTSIQILLHQYDSFLASSFSNFADYQIRMQSEFHADCRRFLGSDAAGSVDGSTDVLGIPRDVALEKLRKAEEIVQAWRDFHGDLPSADLTQPRARYRLLLNRAYRGYKKRFTVQKSLHEGDVFTSCIAAAIGRMPMVRRVRLCDYDIRRGIPIRLIDNEHVLLRSMIRPMSWEESKGSGSHQSPLKLLYSLPIAMHKSGANLTCLEIAVSPPEDFSALALHIGNIQDLTDAMRNLKGFKFSILGSGSAVRAIREKGEEEHICKFISTVLNTSSVQDIFIDLDRLWSNLFDRSPLGFTLVASFSPRPWPNLERLCWRGARVHLADFKHFFERARSVRAVFMMQLHLLTGTWADLLDLLRNILVGHVRIRFPSGAECSRMSDEEKWRIFDSRQVRVDSLADGYIMKRLANNPLRPQLE